MSPSSDFTLRSPLSLVVLALLFERPMHPYLMQKLIVERGKDKVVNVRSRNSVQQTVTRLERAGLIESSTPSREGGHPARTVYSLTDEGAAALLDALHDALARPALEHPMFAAALSFMSVTTVGAVTEMLTRRRAELDRRIDEEQISLDAGRRRLPEIFLIENDYIITMLEAERAWIDRALAAIRAGALTWDTDQLRTDALTGN
ncbi:hypothetical protein ALI144C_04425 [Actinosynnema sp. ALI-1.44]|uniref:PadR family transcriptional regulator n=1 Tax=Actinosynnema sp. ALI-1.44 TaxID=1933779 RepID=UPI00097C6317|nr:PadR family transcriptional regulator [Actinosynnema sp. ALI-1.44]ONI89594.1 hypothetical protein ALI144C_04425 [Actinosynnema sp. ALI-1.44]